MYYYLIVITCPTEEWQLAKIEYFFVHNDFLFHLSFSMNAKQFREHVKSKTFSC